jgi:hypothetical protein
MSGRPYNNPSFFVPVNHPAYGGAHLEPPFPGDVSVHYERYWEKVVSNRYGPGESIQRQVVHKVGTTTQDSTLISAELGVAAGGLSGKLTETLNHVVTITTESDTTEVIDYKVPPGKICVFSIWNLVHGFEFKDAAGRLIDWSGTSFLNPGGRGRGAGRRGMPFSFPSARLTHRSHDTVQDPVLFDA